MNKKLIHEIVYLHKKAKLKRVWPSYLKRVKSKNNKVSSQVNQVKKPIYH